jgi:HEAT repeat protein
VPLRVPFPVTLVERRLTAILFLHGFCAVGAFVAGRSARDALFLAQLGSQALAWMYIASAAAVALFGLGYSAFAANVRPDRATVVSSLAFALLFAASWLAERTGRPWVYAALYVHVEVMGALSVLQFWTLANELFNPREARRLYGLVGAGGIISNLIVGLATVQVARAFGASAVLVLCVALMLGCVVSALLAGSAGRHRLAARPGQERTSAGTLAAAPRHFSTSGHLRLVALLTLVTFLAVTIIDFEFKVAASASVKKDELAVYFGYFYVVVGGLAVVLQLFGTRRLLDRVGVIGSLAILPVILGAGSLLVAVFQQLWAAAITKGADTLFRYSINDATTQILYLPVPARWRASSKAFIDGVVKPFAIASAGLLLLAYRWWLPRNPFHVALPCAALCAAWVAVVLGLRSRYVRTLQDNLRKRHPDVDFARYRVEDGSTSRVLMRALESGDPRQVLNSLELLPQLHNVHLEDRVEPLLDHESATIRVAALNYYARRPTIRHANSIFRRLDDPDPAVRAAAIATFCLLGRDKSVGTIRSYLDDADPRIRGAALTGMIRYGGLDGIISAADALKQLINHSNPLMRQHAAKVLKDIAVSNFYQPVLQLMGDPDRAVRREAISAAGELRSPELIMPLIQRTRSSESGREAVEALCAYGPTIAPTVGKALANRFEDPQVRRGAVRVLGRIGGTAATNVVFSHLGEPDDELRTAVYHCLAKIARTQRVGLSERKALQRALDQELILAYRFLSHSETLDLGSGPPGDASRFGLEAAQALLSSALAEKMALAQRRLFLLLMVLYPNADMERIEADLRDGVAIAAPRRRANAVELLDNLLDRETKRRLLPLVEDVPNVEKLAAVAELLPPRRATRDETIEALCRDETAWLRACALNYAAHFNWALVPPLALELTRDPSPIVREVAVLSTHRASPEAGAVYNASQRTQMLSTLEKVLLLKSIDLFSKVAGEALAQVALISVEESRESGEVIFSEGEQGDALYLVTEGKVRLYRDDKLLMELGERECFGEMALLDSAPRTATVIALNAVNLLKIDRDEFQEILTDKPEVALGIIRVLSSRLRNATG